MQYDFYSWRSLPFSFMNWVTCVKPPPGFEPVHPDCEADDVPTELSHPPTVHSMFWWIFWKKWEDAFDRSKSSGAPLMDLSKAFDSIPHDLLLTKLNSYDIEEGSLTLIGIYLRNRKQHEKIVNIVAKVCHKVL